MQKGTFEIISLNRVLRNLSMRVPLWNILTIMYIKRKHMIYFVRERDENQEYTPYVKIGYTNGDSTVRLSTLQTSNPRQLVIVRSEEGDENTESYYHELYKLYNVRGEWFEWQEEMDTGDAPIVIGSRNRFENRKVLEYNKKRIVRQAKLEAYPYLAAVIGITQAKRLLGVKGSLLEDVVDVNTVDASRKVKARLRKELKKLYYQRYNHRFNTWYSNKELMEAVDNKYLQKHGLL